MAVAVVAVMLALAAISFVEALVERWKPAKEGQMHCPYCDDKGRYDGCPGCGRFSLPSPNHPRNIPANSNSIENGASDPTPEAGKGGLWRASVSWLKGWFQ